MMPTAKEFVAVAAQYVGYREKATNAQLDSKTANAGHANYNRFARDLRKRKPWAWLYQGSAWCCEFVSAYVAETCGWDVAKTQKLLGGSAEMSCNRLWNQMKKAGKTMVLRGRGTPQVGDFIFFQNSGGINHIGLVEKVTSTHVHTIEGNSSDMVKRKDYALTSGYIYGYGRPGWDKASTDIIKESESVTAKYLKGADVSSHDVDSHAKHTDPILASEECGFVIAKATQGTTYKNPHFAKQLEDAFKRGQLLGCYHYAAGRDAKAEAAYFYKAVNPYVGKATFWLDWESYQNASWGDKDWCLAFATEFHRLSGVWPGIYVQASAIDQVASCSRHCALWVAGYPVAGRDSWTAPKFPYSTAPWPTYSIWQYTSAGGTDRNVSKLTKADWAKLANGDGESTPAPAPETKPKPQKRTYRVIAKSGLNIRSGAGTGYAVKSSVRRKYEFSSATRKKDAKGRYWAKINSGWLCLGKPGAWYVKRLK